MEIKKAFITGVSPNFLYVWLESIEGKKGESGNKYPFSIAGKINSQYCHFSLSHLVSDVREYKALPVPKISAGTFSRFPGCAVYRI